MTMWAPLGVLLIVATVIHAETNDNTDLTYVQKELPLYQYLLDPTRYNPDLMPITNSTKPLHSNVDLKYSLELIQLVDIDERANRVAMNVWVNMQWTDFMLKWTPADHDDITSIWLPYTRIWKPDMEIFNDAAHSHRAPGTHLAIVNSNGLVTWITQQRLEIVCAFDMRHFPFDSHDCYIKVGPWTYSAKQLNIDVGGDGKGNIGGVYFSAHQEWDLESTGGKKNVVEYPCCPDSGYADLTFNFRLTRKAGYYDCIFIAPAILLSILVPMLFVLGPNNKFALGAGMLVTLSVFLEVLENKIPVAHGSVPLIAQYYVGLFAFITLALVLSTITANLAERSSYRMPPPIIIRRIFLDRLSSLLCVNVADYAPINTVSSISGMDDESVGHDFDGQIIPPKVGAVERGQWRALAATFDRLFFILTTICLIIFSIVVTSH